MKALFPLFKVLNLSPEAVHRNFQGEGFAGLH